MAGADGEKNLKPTPKRLKEARKRGQLSRSRELAGAAGFLAAIGVLAMTGALVLERLRLAIGDALSHLDAAGRAEPTAAHVWTTVTTHASTLIYGIGPIALAAGAAGVATSIAQGGLSFSTIPLQPNLQRLSPASGFRRLAFSQSGIDTLKAIIVAALLSVLVWRIGKELAVDSLRLLGAQTVTTAARGWSLLLRLLWQVGFAFLVAGAVDYALQRWRLMSSLKMSRQEVQEEVRSEEGRPEVKARVRRIQRDMARRRMLQAVPRATVVITNPTHFAVALEYNREKTPAPIVIAKGRDLLAARIREIAREHGVPIIENPSLARSLFAGAEVGETIPAPLFGAVAEVLAYLVRIRQLML
jgi:flagellar biosynthetic protein FlhB